MRRICALVAFLGVSSASWGQLTAAEQKGLSETLYIGNLTPADLQLGRTAGSSLGLVSEATTKPLSAADAIMGTHALASNRSIAQLLGHLRTKVFSDRDRFEASTPSEVTVPDEVPEVLRAPLKRLVASLLSASEGVRQAIEKLSPEEKRTLIEGLPRWAMGQAGIKFEFVRQPMPDRATLLKLLAKCDLARIRYSAHALAQDVQEEIPKLREIASQIVLERPLKLTVNGLVVEIGGTGADLHDSTDAALCLDFGGNDRYTGRYGAGVGYAALLIDLDGDDTYEIPDLSIGAGVLGVGLAYDLGGTDSFRGKSLCFGVGLAGVGALLKDGGDDVYQSAALAQGMGFFGIGMLLDTRGEDRYTLGFMGQGAGRMQGVGWLIDKSGGDVYRSGGMVPSSWGETWHLSMAQGYGAGEGDLPGGVGLLTDLAGDDTYVGEVACQAAGRDGGLGTLYDLAGNDTYNAAHEAQASASRAAGAYLFDLAGGDGYLTRGGNCHAFGHDYGVAFLLDRAGSDVYAAQDSRPATANANGLAIFLDADGEDRYLGPPGVGNAARGTGSLAVFCDLGGMDAYAEGLANGTGVAGRKWAVVYDAISYAAKPPPAEANPPKVGSRQLPGDAEMDTLLRQASGGTLDDAGKALDTLIAVGEPGVKWILEKRLGVLDIRQVRAFAWVAREVGAKAKGMVAAEIGNKDDAVARNAILACLEGEFAEASPFLLAAIKRPALTSVATRTAGALRAKDCVDVILPLANAEDPTMRQIAIVALAQIGDAKAFEKMQSLLTSEDLVTRKAAIDLVAQFPDRALPVAKSLAASAAERAARTGIEILAAVGTSDALAEAGKALSDMRRGVQIQALLALDGRCPKDYRKTLTDLRRSPDALVAAVANRVDVGR